jgi:hypothetical protein
VCEYSQVPRWGAWADLDLHRDQTITSFCCWRPFIGGNHLVGCTRGACWVDMHLNVVPAAAEALATLTSKRARSKRDAAEH